MPSLIKLKNGAVALGIPTDKKFLTGIIPETWSEIVYENDTFWTCEVKGERLSSKQWESLHNQFKEEFGPSFVETYSYNENGAWFVLYLKKKNN